MSFFHKFLLMFCVVLISGCASKELKSKISLLETENQVLQNKVKNLSKDLSNVSEELILIKGQSQEIKTEPMERQQVAVKKSKKKSKTTSAQEHAKNPFFEEDIMDNDDDIEPDTLVFTNKDLDNIQWGNPEAGSKKTNPKAATKSTSPVKEDYKEAYQAFVNQDYERCKRLMHEFIKKYPQHDYTDNAHFWIGESYYAEGDYKMADVYYKNVIREFPNGNKVPDSMYRSANCALKMSKDSIARQSLEILIQKYPKTVAATKAQKTLKTIK